MILLKFLLTTDSFKLRCKVTIKEKTQDMMESLAEETVAESCTTPAKRKKEQEHIGAKEQEEEEHSDSENEDVCAETEEQTELEELEILKEIKKVVKMVRNDSLGHLRRVSILALTILLAKILIHLPPIVLCITSYLIFVLHLRGFLNFGRLII
jgi:hypothetical protein